jgi:hypothetical protein
MTTSPIAIVVNEKLSTSRRELAEEVEERLHFFAALVVDLPIALA